MSKPKLTILLAAPRGFCAGVDRAIKIVEKALDKYGAPVYVRHEIVHNRFVVENLQDKGAIFVKELDEIPDGYPVIFSAHGVPKSVPAAAKARELFYLDATCPLVSKVHREAEQLHEEGKHIIMIGHAGHPEVIGTTGQVPAGTISLIETVEDVATAHVPDENNLAYITQTTLSVDETKDIIAALEKRFPNIQSPAKEDICYATTNRQAAAKEIAGRAQAFLVVGSPNSSNSNRLVEVGKQFGCKESHLVLRSTDINWNWLEGVTHLGLTAGASAPDVLVQEVINACRERFNVTVEEVMHTEEKIVFHLPKELRDKRQFDRKSMRQAQGA